MQAARGLLAALVGLALVVSGMSVGPNAVAAGVRVAPFEVAAYSYDSLTPTYDTHANDVQSARIDQLVEASVVHPPTDRSSGFLDQAPSRGQGFGVAAETEPVLFGQARIGANFSTKADVPAYLSGRPLADVSAELRAGSMSPDAIAITAFEREGQFVTVNNRGLAALSDAGLGPRT